MSTPTLKPAPGLLTRGAPPTALVDLVLASLPSPNTRRSYERSIAELYRFAEDPEAGRLRPITLLLLLEWRAAMAGRLAASTVNLRITAIRRLIREARRTKLIAADEAADLMQIDGLPRRGVRLGNWLTLVQIRHILDVPGRKSLRGLRNYCILAVLIGCALRVSELAHVDVESIQQRDGRWVFADLVGKGGRVRTVPIPILVHQAIAAWTKAAKIASGRLIRPLTMAPEGLSASGRLIRPLTMAPEGLSTQGIWDIVSKAGARIGVPHLGPHDLRRSCARLCKEQGGDMEQIQFLLGHASILTTQRYLGSTHNLKEAVNDNLGL